MSDFDRTDLDAFDAADPPEGFADRVLAARDAASSDSEGRVPPVPAFSGRDRSYNPKWLKNSAVIVAIASAAVIAFAIVRGPKAPEVSGAVRATARETVTLGTRGVAVAEPGASFDWKVVGTGNASVEQTRGSVFYRVERGGPFVVSTPAGDITVTGTCFAVEIRPMKPSKQTLTGAAVGAALSATVLLTVYEGRVLFANDSGKTEVAAGQSAVSGPGAMPRLVVGGPTEVAAATLPPAPAPDATRAELLERDAEQRARIAALEQRLTDMAGGARTVVRRGPGGSGDHEDGDWLNPTQEQLDQFAKDCRVRIDAPTVFGPSAPTIGPKMAAEMGVSEQERVALNKVIEQFREQMLEEIRQLYVDATGDVDGASSLSLEAMKGELVDKSAPGEAGRVRGRIAQERAGQVPRPTSTEGMTPYEQYFRLLAESGDEFQRAIASVVGAERARMFREEQGGWGMRMDMGGCPDSGVSEDVDVQ